MRTLLQVLSKDERAQVHERTLEILSTTGVRVDTARGRQILGDAGAEVDQNTNVVCFPRALVEESLRLAPKEFTLGARRPGYELRMNGGDCTLSVDGEGIFALDRGTGERRPSTVADWLAATRLIDALDPVGVWWCMVEASDRTDTMADYVGYLRDVFGNFSKHVQDSTATPEQTAWLLEVLQVVFGNRETIRRQHPFSFLLCPLSPLVIEEAYTDAYLALLGADGRRSLDIPVAVMPMPLMGATAPGSLISTTVVGNCDALAMLCLVQASAPGTPFIYAPALSIMNPRTGGYSPGAVENGLLGAAAVEMARYYGLPAEGTGGGSECYAPGIQAGYERAMNALLPLLSWPDVLVGVGLLGGSMILSLEQLLIDVEVFEMARRAHQGIATGEDKWLDDVIDRVGPGGNFLAQRSTREGTRSGEWYVSEFGWHGTYGKWVADGKPTLLDEARQRVDEILSTHEPLPLGEDVERELDRIQRRAREES